MYLFHIFFAKILQRMSHLNLFFKILIVLKCIYKQIFLNFIICFHIIHILKGSLCINWLPDSSVFLGFGLLTNLFKPINRINIIIYYKYNNTFTNIRTYYEIFENIFMCFKFYSSKLENYVQLFILLWYIF